MNNTKLNSKQLEVLSKAFGNAIPNIAIQAAELENARRRERNINHAIIAVIIFFVVLAYWGIFA